MVKKAVSQSTERWWGIWTI